MTQTSRGAPSPWPSAQEDRRLSLPGAIAANAAAGTLFAWSVLLPALGAQLRRGPLALGPVFATSLAAFAVAVVFGGASVDRQGPRRAVMVAGLLCGGGLVLGAYSVNVLMLHLGIGVLFGLGSGLVYLSTVSYATTRAGQRRGWAVGAVIAAYAAGPMVAAPLGGLSADRWGARATLSVAAVAVGGVIVVAGHELPGPLNPALSADGVKVAPVGDRAALAALWCFSLGAFAPGLFGFAYAANIATQHGASPRGAAVAVAVLAAANVAGRLLATPLSNRIGLCAALAFVLGVVALALVTLARLPAAPATASLSLLGMQYGVTSALLPLAVRGVCGQRRFATAYGRVFSSWGAAGLVGPAVGAALYDDVSGFAHSSEALLLGVMVAATALAVYHRRRGRL